MYPTVALSECPEGKAYPLGRTVRHAKTSGRARSKKSLSRSSSRSTPARPIQSSATALRSPWIHRNAETSSAITAITSPEPSSVTERPTLSSVGVPFAFSHCMMASSRSCVSPAETCPASATNTQKPKNADMNASPSQMPTTA